jgi:DNA-binding NarL/FixJ family response regulator
MHSRTTVILVDDHKMLRDGIRVFLEQHDGIIVVAEAENGREAIALAAKHAPDIMLIDIGMPDMNGLEATRRILSADPKIGVIALSMHSDGRYVRGMFDAGARGYLLKTCDAAELIRAISAVQKGRSYVTSEVTDALLDRHRLNSRTGAAADDANAPPAEILTSREREVLQLIAEGLSSKEIAVRLGRGLKTIETHRTNIIRKLDLHSIAALTKYAIREGLTSLGD